ncbi:hypothetical protein L0222_05565 [bacterium]|nr:hypothetical protein [bacterium]MCI0603920.1 hypothetical protein [bacterium]
MEFYGLIDWSRYDGIDNTKAISLLSKRTELEIPAGSDYKYTNSGYVLIASDPRYHRGWVWMVHQ